MDRSDVFKHVDGRSVKIIAKPEGERGDNAIQVVLRKSPSFVLLLLSSIICLMIALVLAVYIMSFNVVLAAAVLVGLPAVGGNLFTWAFSSNKVVFSLGELVSLSAKISLPSSRRVVVGHFLEKNTLYFGDTDLQFYCAIFLEDRINSNICFVTFSSCGIGLSDLLLILETWNQPYTLGPLIETRAVFLSTNPVISDGQRSLLIQTASSSESAV